MLSVKVRGSGPFLGLGLIVVFRGLGFEYIIRVRGIGEWSFPIFAGFYRVRG